MSILIHRNGLRYLDNGHIMKDPNYRREKEKYEHPIASREAILTRMADIGEPVSFKRLAKELGYENTRDRDALKARLRAMTRDAQVIADRRNVYALPGKLELYAGRISAHADGFGFRSWANTRYLPAYEAGVVGRSTKLLLSKAKWSTKRILSASQISEIINVRKFSKNRSEPFAFSFPRFLFRE